VRTHRLCTVVPWLSEARSIVLYVALRFGSDPGSLIVCVCGKATAREPPSAGEVGMSFTCAAPKSPIL
jgi:hypothetical protein